MHQTHLNRRRFLFQASLGAAAFYTVPGAFAEALTKTPPQTEGPFYPDKLPLDTDNDLLIINDGITPAVGPIVHLGGTVVDAKGNPMRNAVVELWQTDINGVYLHSGSSRRKKYDGNFQGYGRFLTNAKGEYYFRTIKPVAYGPRTPHFHVSVNRGKEHGLVTQSYLKGEKQNERDGIFRRIGDKKKQESVLVDFQPLKGSKTGEEAGTFDIVMGYTPEDVDHS